MKLIRAKRIILVMTALLGLALLAGCGKTGYLCIFNCTGETGATQTITIGADTGGTAGVDNVTLTFPAGAVDGTTVVTVDSVSSTQLTVPLDTCKTYIKGFKVSTNPTTVTVFNVAVPVGGNVSNTITAGTTLVLAQLKGSTWVDVATFSVGANGLLNQNLLSVALPGLKSPGTYVLYQATSGCSTAVSNLGILLVADDSNGSGSAAGSIQVIRLYDAQGNLLTTPTISYMSYSGAGDLDGQAMTPDGAYGVAVDGGNTLRFFSGVNTGNPTASSTTINVSAYGGDGDSVAIMPNGDEAVVSADSSSVLLLVSGIAAGNPKAAMTIPVPSPGYFDGLVISADGKVLLARGYYGLVVYSITAKATPVTGTLGGTVSHDFTQVQFFSGLGATTTSDARQGMALSPTDSSRAVLIGGSTITLMTGLTSTPVASSPVTFSGASTGYSVSITPDGKYAIVGTNAGLLMFSGVDTGTLTQVGTVFAPTFTSGSTTYNLTTVSTLGITLDGKYVAALSPQPSYSNATLLIVPISPTGFGAIAAKLTGVACPYTGNDQILMH